MKSSTRTVLFLIWFAIIISCVICATIEMLQKNWTECSIYTGIGLFTNWISVLILRKSRKEKT